MSNWYPLAQGVSGPSRFVTQFCLSKNYLIAGGTFTSAGNVTSTNLAIWDGIGWISPPGGGIFILNGTSLSAGYISSIVEFDNKIFIAGRFNSVNTLKPLPTLEPPTNTTDDTDESTDEIISPPIDNNLDNCDSVIALEIDTDGIFSWNFIPGLVKQDGSIALVSKLRVYDDILYAIGNFDEGIKQWDNQNQEWITITNSSISSILAEKINVLSSRFPYDLIKTNDSYYIPDIISTEQIYIGNPVAFYNDRLIRFSLSNTTALQFSLNNGITWTDWLNSIPNSLIVGSGTSTQLRSSSILFIETSNINGNDVLLVGGSFKRLGSSNPNIGMMTYGIGIWNGISWNNLNINEYISPLPEIYTIYPINFKSGNIVSGIYVSGRLTKMFPGLSANTTTAFYTDQEVLIQEQWPPYGTELTYGDVCAPIFRCGVSRKEKDPVCEEIELIDPREETFNMPYDAPNCWAWTPNYKPSFFEAKIMSSIVKVEVTKSEYDTPFLNGEIVSFVYKNFSENSLRYMSREYKNCKYYFVFQYKTNLSVGNCEINNQNLNIIFPNNLFGSAEYDPTSNSPYWVGYYKYPC